MKDISEAEARASLGAIEEAMAVTRGAVERVAGRIVLGWGLAYLAGPLAVHFAGEAGKVVLNVGIVLAAIWTGVASSRGVVSGANSARFGIAWGVLFGFGALWFLILMAGSLEAVDGERMARQMWAYGVSLAMFAYVIMGMWWGRIYLWLGVLVTAGTVGALFWMPPAWYWLWCGLWGGGLLTAGGVYLMRSGGRR